MMFLQWQWLPQIHTQTLGYGSHYLADLLWCRWPHSVVVAQKLHSKSPLVPTIVPLETRKGICVYTSAEP